MGHYKCPETISFGCLQMNESCIPPPAFTIKFLYKYRDIVKMRITSIDSFNKFYY